MINSKHQQNIAILYLAESMYEGLDIPKLKLCDIIHQSLEERGIDLIRVLLGLHGDCDKADNEYGVKQASIISIDIYSVIHNGIYEESSLDCALGIMTKKFTQCCYKYVTDYSLAME